MAVRTLALEERGDGRGRRAAEFTLTVAKPFDFVSTASSYGWVVLSPCRWDRERSALLRTERLTSGDVVDLAVSGKDEGEHVRLVVRVQAKDRLGRADIEELRAKVRWMLRLDEGFSEFYRLAEQHGALNARLRPGRGRLLRSPTLFEDVVKTICTTNTTWSQTVGMVQRLVETLGDPFPIDRKRRAFPTPERIARAKVSVLRRDVRLGYRSEYIYRLASELASGRLDLEALRTADAPTSELKQTLKKIKGVGEYAANTLLMVLGRYDELAIDSEMRRFVSRRYFGGSPVSDAQIRSIYERWGKWKYLAYWFEAD